MVAIVNIEKELNRLWDEEHGKDKIHASLFNLIIYTETEEKKLFFQNLIKTIINKFPCRILFIAKLPSKEKDALNISVSSNTTQQGQMGVFCEQIVIEYSDTYKERVCSLVLPHILPDLPVYLVWTQDPSFSSDIFFQLQPYAQRIIFDSYSIFDMQQFSLSLLHLMKKGRNRIGELCWSELSRWRKVISDSFNTSHSIDELLTAEHIEIRYNAFEKEEGKVNTVLKAYYLQAWIAAQLNWKFKAFNKKNGRITINYSGSFSNDITIDLIADTFPKLYPASIVEFRLESKKDGAEYIFKRNPDNQQISIHQSNKDQCFLPYVVTIPYLNPGQEILQDIFYTGTGQHFKNTLELVSQINWK